MGLFALGAIFGTGIGPVWAGFVAGNPALEWRWIQFIQAIYTGGGFLLLLVFLRETRGSVLLTRKAAKLRKETGDLRYRAKAEAERASIAILIRNSLTRPLWSECFAGGRFLFSWCLSFGSSVWLLATRAHHGCHR